MPAESESQNAATLTRRQFLKAAGVLGLAGATGRRLNAAESVTMPFVNGQRSLVTFPQKRPMILLTTRPPQLETPFSVFNEGLLTPNDAFFVRYHLSQIPTSIDPEKFTVAIKGKVNTPTAFSLNDLKTKFSPVEI